MTAVVLPPCDQSLTDNKSYWEAQKRAKVKCSVKKDSRPRFFLTWFPSASVSRRRSGDRGGMWGWRAGKGQGWWGIRQPTPPVQSLPSSWRAFPCLANSPRTHNSAVSPGNIGGLIIPGRRCRGHIYLIINSPVVNRQKRGNSYIIDWQHFSIPRVQILLLKTGTEWGVPGWLSSLSIGLRLRSCSHSFWVWAPCWTLYWQLTAWRLLQILCLPICPSPAHARMLSFSLSLKNK